MCEKNNTKNFYHLNKKDMKVHHELLKRYYEHKGKKPKYHTFYTRVVRYGFTFEEAIKTKLQRTRTKVTQD